MVASDDRYRATGPNHVEYFASSAVPMPPPHIQTIRPFVSGRRKSDGQRVCPTNQRHYAVAVFATDALRLHQLQCQPPQRQCFSIRCHGRKTFALFAAETSRKRSHANSHVGTAHARLAGTTASQMWIATPTIMRPWQLSPVLPAPKRACRDRADPRARRAHPGPAFEV